MKDLIVHCPTEESWYKVQVKMFEEGAGWSDTGKGLWGSPKDGPYIHLKGETMKTIWECELEGRRFISAEEYLQEPFEDKSAKEQGIDTSRYFTVVQSYRGNKYYKIGDLVQIEIDDESKYPYFWNITKHPEKQSHNSIHWYRLRYATQEEIDAVIGKKKGLTQPQSLEYIKQYQAGLRNGDMGVSGEAKEFIWSLLAEQFNKELTEEAEKRIKKAEKEK